MKKRIIEENSRVREGNKYRRKVGQISKFNWTRQPPKNRALRFKALSITTN